MLTTQDKALHGSHPGDVSHSALGMLGAEELEKSLGGEAGAAFKKPAMPGSIGHHLPHEGVRPLLFSSQTRKGHGQSSEEGGAVEVNSELGVGQGESQEGRGLEIG